MALVAAFLALAATCAQAQVDTPVFPHDVTVFPERDFVSCAVSRGQAERDQGVVYGLAACGTGYLAGTVVQQQLVVAWRSRLSGTGASCSGPRPAAVATAPNSTWGKAAAVAAAGWAWPIASVMHDCCMQQQAENSRCGSFAGVAPSSSAPGQERHSTATSTSLHHQPAPSPYPHIQRTPCSPTHPLRAPTCTGAAFCLQGYDKFVDRFAEVEVKRNGVVTGRATAKVGAGDPSFEINHPGGE